jgi:hypothetical protein
MLHNPAYTHYSQIPARLLLRAKPRKLVYKSMDALRLAALYRRHGDNDVADLFVAMSIGYMRRARRLH